MEDKWMLGEVARGGRRKEMKMKRQTKEEWRDKKGKEEEPKQEGGEGGKYGVGGSGGRRKEMKTKEGEEQVRRILEKAEGDTQYAEGV